MRTTPPNFQEREFRKASASNPDKNCVEVARRGGWVELRDDKLKGTAAYATRVLRFTDDEFDSYLASVREGRSNEGLCLEITFRAEAGMYLFRRSDSPATELEFNEREVRAFREGMFKREFDAIANARKRGEGKRHSQAVLALARRRLNVIWAMLRDNTAYTSSTPPTDHPIELRQAS